MSIRLRRTALVAAAALAISLLGMPQPAIAAPTWLPAGPVGSAFSNGYVGTVDVDSAGNAVALWSGTNGSMNQIQASSRPAGGTWGPAIPVSVPGASAVFPEVVLADDGTATAVWFRSTGALSFGLQSATRDANGVWSAVVDIAGSSGVFDEAALGLLPDGGAIVVWPRFSAGSWYEFVSVRAPGGAWSDPVSVSAASGSDPGRPALGVDAAGNTTVVWTLSNGANQIIETRTRTSGGVWSAVEPLSQLGQDAIYPSVAVAPAGTATAVWARSDSTRYIAQSSTRTAPGASWSSPVNLSANHLSVSGTDVATSTSGRVVATWAAAPDGLPSRVQAATRSQGAGWGPGVDLSDSTAEAEHPRAVMAANGVATVAWTRFNGSVNVVQGSSAPPGAGFGSATDLSDAALEAYPPRVAVDPHGDVVTFWVDAGGSAFQARYRTYDVAGPVVTFTIPAKVTAGKTVAFTSAATDTWSSVASYFWSFGDGDTALGQNVTHAYEKAGSYDVLLTVTDAVGNATTTPFTTTVTAPVPVIGKFKLSKRKIQGLERAVAKKTKLKVRLNTAATLKLVFKSKHKHPVKGKNKYVRVVLKKKLPAGLSKITIKAKVKGKVLKPDTYKIVGTAKNSTGKSPKKKAKLVVVRP